MEKINYTYLSTSEMDGPGYRAVLHTQGCNFACEGCFNKQLWDTSIEKNLVTPEELMRKILQFKNIEGITISGGEPLLQQKSVLYLCKLAKWHNLGTMIYTGYTLDDLNNFIFSAVDILVSGRYDKNIPATNIWAGSGNQEVTFLTNRYKRFENTIKGAGGFSITIAEDGDKIIHGFPTPKVLRTLEK